jgi:hypothetical protein
MLPLIHEQESRKFPLFRVLDCGPLMTPILIKTLSLLGYTFEVVGDTTIEDAIFLEDWDYEWIDYSLVEKVIKRVKSAWSDDLCCESIEYYENLLLVRSQPDDYYINGNAEIKGYGTSRREITNWREIMAYIKKNYISIAAYQPGNHSLGCQIKTFRKAKKIIGMRGAEWANTVWCDHLNVLIFDPSPPANTLISLLKRKNVTYRFYHVDHVKCVIDPKIVYDYLKSPS